MKAETQVDLLVADEVWIATALLHRATRARGEHFRSGDRGSRGRRNSAGSLRPGVEVHVRFIAWRTAPPSPRGSACCTTRARAGDCTVRATPVTPDAPGKIAPQPDDIPEKYRYLLDWYRREYAAPPRDTWLQGIFEMVGAGKDLFAGLDPDEYVRRNREGWE